MPNSIGSAKQAIDLFSAAQGLPSLVGAAQPAQPAMLPSITQPQQPMQIPGAAPMAGQAPAPASVGAPSTPSAPKPNKVQPAMSSAPPVAQGSTGMDGAKAANLCTFTPMDTLERQMNAACGALSKIANSLDGTTMPNGIPDGVDKLAQTAYITKNTSNIKNHRHNNTRSPYAGISKSATGFIPQVPQIPMAGAGMSMLPEAQTTAPSVDPQYQDNAEADINALSKKTAPMALPGIDQGTPTMPGQDPMMGNSMPGNSLAQATTGLGVTIGNGAVGYGVGAGSGANLLGSSGLGKVAANKHFGDLTVKDRGGLGVDICDRDSGEMKAFFTEKGARSLGDYLLSREKIT